VSGAGERPLALLGGTFDPVHYGHLRLADEVRRALAPLEMRLVPARDPPHRGAPSAGAADRLAMLRLAIGPVPAGAESVRRRAASVLEQVNDAERRLEEAAAAG